MAEEDADEAAGRPSVDAYRLPDRARYHASLDVDVGWIGADWIGWSDRVQERPVVRRR